MFSDDLNVWMMDKGFRNKWKNPFRVYSRMKAESFTTPKCFGMCMALVTLLSLLSVLSSLFFFPFIFDVEGERSSFLFDAVFFLIVFIFNMIAIYQSKGADDVLYAEYCRNQVGLVVLLIGYGIATIFLGYSTFLASMFISFCMGVGIIGVVCEMNFKRSALKGRKSQIDRLQDLRELNKYLKKEILVIERMPNDQRAYCEPVLKQYKTVLEKSRLEYAYLENVLK